MEHFCIVAIIYTFADLRPGILPFLSTLFVISLIANVASASGKFLNVFSLRAQPMGKKITIIILSRLLPVGLLRGRDYPCDVVEPLEHHTHSFGWFLLQSPVGRFSYSFFFNTRGFMETGKFPVNSHSPQIPKCNIILKSMK